MAELFASGRIIDLILGLIVIEAIIQIGYSAIAARGPAVPEVLLNLAPGAFLMLALRASLTAMSWRSIALALTAALFCHLADVGYRWRRSRLPSRFLSTAVGKKNSLQCPLKGFPRSNRQREKMKATGST